MHSPTPDVDIDAVLAENMQLRRDMEGAVNQAAALRRHAQEETRALKQEYIAMRDSMQAAEEAAEAREKRLKGEIQALYGKLLEQDKLFRKALLKEQRKAKMAAAPSIPSRPKPVIIGLGLLD